MNFSIHLLHYSFTFKIRKVLNYHFLISLLSLIDIKLKIRRIMPQNLEINLLLAIHIQTVIIYKCGVILYKL